MKTFVHIGFPKNFSTSLQRSYFRNHPDIHYLGICVEGDLDYRNAIINELFEVGLRTANTFYFQDRLPLYQKAISDQLDIAKKLNKKVVGVSSEHIAFSFSHDSIDFHTKINRLQSVFPDDLEVFVILRRQSDLIKSLYKESIRVGLGLTFKEYTDELIQFQDRNFLFEFEYSRVIKLLIDSFGVNKTHVNFFENFKSTKGETVQVPSTDTLLTDWFDEILKIDSFQGELGHYNRSLNSTELEFKRRLNQNHKHDLGNHLLSGVELHRQKVYFQEVLGIEKSEEEFFKDVLTKRKLIKEAIVSAQNNPEVRTSFDLSDKTNKHLTERFEDSNKELQALLNVTLPETYLNLRF